MKAEMVQALVALTKATLNEPGITIFVVPAEASEPLVYVKGGEALNRQAPVETYCFRQEFERSLEERAGTAPTAVGGARV